ncbi:hypothetical protein KAFR_0G01780 [Kazachstania africana CBS 2517]|uniref:CN hydrolase domain-containing protein n=1 Tax=Kazachstania africana (strain ATCC 22294 / BCRC 22015 / CBS 2517 / CECT 1963 / NBRC 1671 / NRRL Y-8276) TaxID=1071382 RepID=H2AXW2_KAZAF|nr:hypothetical protein KAFR_0G01780 [Kazachstania africana CBS 2517]CCF59212.1 hypothetical protein KAFR_0G01780 [Kazachstania africana CBS 2517]
MVSMRRIAIGQLCSGSNVASNLDIVTKLIAKALDQDVRVLFFPEATDFLSRNPEHSFHLVKKSEQFVSDLQTNIKDLCSSKLKKIDVSIGIHLPPNEDDIRRDNNKTKNTLLYINYKGEILHSYQKIHLFDVVISNGSILKESNSVLAGNKIPKILETPIGKLGTGICYDIRFPELALDLRKQGAEILCFPSAFTIKTGEAHWELLGRARAIDTQCFVVMPAQHGEHNVQNDDWTGSGTEHQAVSKRVSWGHSMIISPWGDIVAKSNSKTSEPELIIADLNFELLTRVRMNMPLMQHRRNDLFTER